LGPVSDESGSHRDKLGGERALNRAQSMDLLEGLVAVDLGRSVGIQFGSTSADTGSGTDGIAGSISYRLLCRQLSADLPCGSLHTRDRSSTRR
jgi:hypothetical protein